MSSTNAAAYSLADLSAHSERITSMKTVFVLNDPPYGSERCYNALRLAHALLKKNPEIEVTVFLMADAVTAARAGQMTPDGYYNIERMLKRVLIGGGHVLLCSSCMDARGLGNA